MTKLVVLSLLLSSVAWADDMPVAAPASAMPSPVMPVPSRAEALRRQARIETISGAVLFTVGAVLVGAGAALIIDNLCFDNCTSRASKDAALNAGIVFSAIGYGGIFSGIPLLITGAVHKRRAARLSLGAAPIVQQGRYTGGLANVSLRF